MAPPTRRLCVATIYLCSPHPHVPRPASGARLLRLRLAGPRPAPLGPLLHGNPTAQAVGCIAPPWLASQHGSPRHNLPPPITTHPSLTTRIRKPSIWLLLSRMLICGTDPLTIPTVAAFLRERRRSLHAGLFTNIGPAPQKGSALSSAACPPRLQARPAARPKGRARARRVPAPSAAAARSPPLAYECRISAGTRHTLLEALPSRTWHADPHTPPAGKQHHSCHAAPEPSPNHLPT